MKSSLQEWADIILNDAWKKESSDDEEEVNVTQEQCDNTKNFPENEIKFKCIERKL